VVYIASLCFEPELLDAVARVAAGLRPGALCGPALVMVTVENAYGHSCRKRMATVVEKPRCGF
jgi:hypothetical protein